MPTRVVASYRSEDGRRDGIDLAVFGSHLQSGILEGKKQIEIDPYALKGACIV